MGLGQRGLEWPWRDRAWQSVGRTGQAVRPLADPAALQSSTDKPRGPDSEWRRTGQAERQVAPDGPSAQINQDKHQGSKADCVTQGSSAGK